MHFSNTGLSRIKVEFRNEKWENWNEEIKNLWEQCKKIKNKNKGTILAVLPWHIWLERNRRIFS